MKSKVFAVFEDFRFKISEGYESPELNRLETGKLNF